MNHFTDLKAYSQFHNSKSNIRIMKNSREKNLRKFPY